MLAYRPLQQSAKKNTQQTEGHQITSKCRTSRRVEAPSSVMQDDDDASLTLEDIHDKSKDGFPFRDSGQSALKEMEVGSSIGTFDIPPTRTSAPAMDGGGSLRIQDLPPPRQSLRGARKRRSRDLLRDASIQSIGSSMDVSWISQSAEFRFSSGNLSPISNDKKRPRRSEAPLSPKIPETHEEDESGDVNPSSPLADEAKIEAAGKSSGMDMLSLASKSLTAPPVVRKRQDTISSEMNQSFASNGDQSTGTHKKSNVDPAMATKKAPAKRRPSEKRVYVDDKTDMDVLMGRGSGSNNHLGNQRYLAYIAEVQPEYRQIPVEQRMDKTRFSQRVVQHIQKEFGGRFLMKDAKVGKWYVVSDQMARSKVAQALREDQSTEAKKKRKEYKKALK